MAAEPETPRYPIETIRFWYVSPFGGRSGELRANEVGVNRKALEENTELHPEDEVSVAVIGTNPEKPWMFRETYEVVALDDRKPTAAELSPNGEIVLSSRDEFDFVRRPYLQPALGEAVVLKSVPLQPIDAPEWLRELLEKSVRRPDF